MAHPEVNGGLTLNYNTTGDYEGWDTFDRVVNQEWTNGTGTTTLDHYTYMYDFNSNRTSRTNELNSALSETYGYDELNRLVDTNRNGADFQDWELDSLGNWNEFDDDGTSETRTFNEANELLTSSTRVNPIFDAAGNMISGPRPDAPTEEQTYTYDAWNRMVKVEDDSITPVVLAEFEYDGRNFRIQKTAGVVVEAFYYNEGQQLLEEQVAGVTTEEYVWDLRYIDAPVLRETATGVLYYTNDANMNVTGLVDESTGNVIERYHYDPYGDTLYMDGSGLALLVQESAFGNFYLFTGRRLDVETALMYYRARYYDASLGRFTSRDSLEYLSGTASLYVYVNNGPISTVDPTGHVEQRLPARWPFIPSELPYFPSIPELLPSLPRVPLPSDLAGRIARKAGSFSCSSLESLIASFLSTSEERMLFDHYISGAGKPLILTPEQTKSALMSADVFRTKFNAARNAVLGNANIGQPNHPRFSIYSGAPWAGGIGNATATLKTSCNDRNFSWAATISDTYDFDSQWLQFKKTWRSPIGEAKTTLVSLAEMSTRCGWASYEISGSWSGTEDFSYPSYDPRLDGAWETDEKGAEYREVPVYGGSGEIKYYHRHYNDIIQGG